MILTYFPKHLAIQKDLLLQIDSILAPTFKNINFYNNVDLQCCRTSLINFLSKISNSKFHLIIANNISFIRDLHFCIQATKILEDYNNNFTDYKSVITSSIQEILSDDQPFCIAIQEEMNQILTLVNWKKGIQKHV